MNLLKEKLPFVLLTIGKKSPQEPIHREMPPRWNQFIWVTSGIGHFIIDGHSFDLAEGEGVFMRHGYTHSYSGNNFSTMWCTFTASESLLDYAIGDRSHLLFSVPDFLQRETEELIRLAQTNCSTLTLSAAGYSYVTELFSAITRVEDDIVRSVRDYLREHLSSPVSLDDIARTVNMDKFALCRYFKKQKKRSIMEELKHLRVSHAKRLLLYSSYSIEEIGRMCGFESHSYFSMRFRELCGCSPSDYRKQYQ